MLVFAIWAHYALTKYHYENDRQFNLMWLISSIIILFNVDNILSILSKYFHWLIR